MSAIGELECALAIRCLRTRPQPFLLSFGVCFLQYDIVRSFEDGAGIGVSNMLYTSSGATLADERCSSSLRTSLQSERAKYVRSQDFEQIKSMFSALSDLLSVQPSPITAHLVIKTTSRSKTGLVLGFQVPSEKLNRCKSASFLRQAAESICEPSLDWLQVPVSNQCNLDSSKWSTNPNLFWFNSFPGIQTQQHSTRLSVDWTSSPRNLILNWRLDSYLHLFNMITGSQESSLPIRTASKKRKRPTQSGDGDAYKTGPRKAFDFE